MKMSSSEKLQELYDEIDVLLQSYLPKTRREALEKRIAAVHAIHENRLKKVKRIATENAHSLSNALDDIDRVYSALKEL
jgi:hypothetical protein